MRHRAFQGSAIASVSFRRNYCGKMYSKSNFDKLLLLPSNRCPRSEIVRLRINAKFCFHLKKYFPFNTATRISVVLLRSTFCCQQNMLSNLYKLYLSHPDQYSSPNYTLRNGINYHLQQVY